MIKKLMRCLLSVAAAAAVALCSVLPPAAASSGVTFTNVKEETPDLFVHKSVTSAVEGYDPDPNEEFTFTLKLGGKPAKSEKYRLFDSKGNELFNTLLGVKVPWETTSGGSFKLKAGQTAKFEYVGSGKAYEVEEQAKANFLQVSPPGGPASGSVESSGTQVNFVNQYIPPAPPDAPSDQPTTLTVTKNIRFPTGYDLPEAEAQREFSFLLTVDGEPYGGAAYTLTDSDGNELEEGFTDDNGILKLKGGQTAYFDSVPAGVDYKVEELNMPENWYQTASSGTMGATKPSLNVVSFTNTNASFLVTKRINGEDGNYDENAQFDFQLMKADHDPWDGKASYYLYTTGGELVDEELHQTDENGNFKLKGGQATLFVGIPKGTGYNVREHLSDDFTQTLPANPDGYVNKAVSSSVETLPFENKPERPVGSLVVRKTLSSADGRLPTVSRPFTFLLEMSMEDGTWTPVANADYTVAGTAYQTDDEGKFTLKANQTAAFADFSARHEFRVSELAEEMGFGTGIYAEYSISEEDAVQQTELKADDAVFLDFVNNYGAANYQLEIFKTGDRGAPLSGAKFMLFQDEACTIPLKDGETFASDFSGYVKIDMLKKGTYYLLETEAPAGYRLLGKPLAIVIEDPTSSVDGQPVTLEDSVLKTRVANHREFALPTTGGRYPPFIIVGALTIALIALLVYNFRFSARERAVERELEAMVRTYQKSVKEKR